MATIQKSRWADTDSEEGEEVKDETQSRERVITSLPAIDAPGEHSAPKKKHKKKPHHDSEEETSDPNLVTKIVIQPAVAPPKSIREDGTAASKKEIKQKEIEELDSLLQELGVKEDVAVTSAQSAPVQEPAKIQGKNKAKTSKKDIFGNVLAESTVRAEKQKKNKKKEKFPVIPRE